MPRPRRKRSRGRRGPNWKVAGGIVLGAASMFVLAYGFYLFLATTRSHVELDPNSYCHKSGPKSVTAVIIDTTDALNVVQRTDLMNEMESLIAAVPRLGALEMYAVGPVAEEPPQPVFSKCNPGRADEISELTGNPIMVERNWREGFREPLESVLKRILAPAGANSSPILESIQWVVINALTAPGRSKVPRRLVIVSDFLQHTVGLSHYRSAVDFTAFARTAYFRRVRAPLEGIAIDMLVIRRTTGAGVQGRALIRFWTDYFDTQGAKRVRIVDLAG